MPLAPPFKSNIDKYIASAIEYAIKIEQKDVYAIYPKIKPRGAVLFDKELAFVINQAI